MKRKFVVTSSLLLSCVFGLGLVQNVQSNKKVLAEPAQNLIQNGDLSFYKHNDVRLPVSGEETINGVYSYTVDGNSGGHVVCENNNMVGKILWNGETPSTNADIWLCTPNLGSKGAGRYVFEGDFKCSAFTTSDFFGLALSGIKPNGQVFWKEIIVCISADEFKSNDHEVSETLGEYGYKHFHREATLTEEEAACWDTLQCNLFIHDSQKQVVRVDNLSVKKENDDEELLIRNGKYIGDFEAFANTPEKDGKLLTSDKFFGYYMKEDVAGSPAMFTVNDDVSVLRHQYDGVNTNAFSYKKIDLSETGVGNYTVEFDFKLSENADPVDFTAILDCETIKHTSCYNLYAATCIEDLEFLEPSEALPGYYHFSAVAWIDYHTAQNCTSLRIKYDTNGKLDNYVDVTNISVKLKEAFAPKESPKTKDGTEFKNIVMMGDFEDMPVGTSFIPEPTEATAFWGSNALDNPAVVKQDDSGNHYLHMEPGNGKSFGSSFVFLDPAEYSTSDVFCVSFDAKCVASSAVTNPFASHFTFVGATGKESFGIPFNNNPEYGFHDEGKCYTFGTNTATYPFTVSDLGSGWLHYELVFKMNSHFTTTVDSMRFLAGVGYTLDVDNVVFGAYREGGSGDPSSSSSTPEPSSDTSGSSQSSGTPTGGDKKGCGGSIAATCGIISLVSVLGAAIVFSKKKGE